MLDVSNTSDHDPPSPAVSKHGLEATTSGPIRLSSRILTIFGVNSEQTGANRSVFVHGSVLGV